MAVAAISPGQNGIMGYVPIYDLRVVSDAQNEVLKLQNCESLIGLQIPVCETEFA
jgi:hypothetical protein